MRIASPQTLPTLTLATARNAMSHDGALKKIAAGVRAYLAHEHDEFYEPSHVERAVREWFEREVENLLEDVAELLTTPHHGHGFRLRQRLEKVKAGKRTTTEETPQPRAA